MPSFDVVSEIDQQEVKNAIDQATREVATRFDFKDTGSTIDATPETITLHSASEDRLRALLQVIEEKFVKRGISLKSLDYGKVEEATRGTARQVLTLRAGISSDKAREINRFIKENGPKAVSSSTLGDVVRVTGKKRDDLQTAKATLTGNDFELPLQFKNFRD
jgi:cyclic-di-GMP-binding protein